MTVVARTIWDTAEFAELVDHLIATDPVHYTVLATNLDQVRNAAVPREAYWFAIEDGTRLEAASMWTPPFGVHLPFNDTDLAEVMAHHLRNEGLAPPGVGGARAAAEAFAEIWTKDSGETPRPVMEQRLFGVDEVRRPRHLKGKARKNTPSDLNLVTDWGVAFSMEAMRSEPRARSEIQERIQGGTMWLWEVDGRPVSMTFASEPIGGVSRISYVYTPPELRRNGYAGALVAEVSQVILDGGNRAVLFTDLANPTSNHIYQEVGYRPIADHITIIFTDAE